VDPTDFRLPSGNFLLSLINHHLVDKSISSDSLTYFLYD